VLSINSLSGGKTSSYLAIHYPADFNVFSLVTIDDPSCAPKDKSLIKQVSDKLGVDFIATAEDDKTLRVVLDLEQRIGKSIDWVMGESFDNLITRKKALPNMAWRFCTQEMKIKPIFEYWLAKIGEVVSMRIGYRKDEEERSTKFTTTHSYAHAQNTFGHKRYKWKEIEWRVGDFPLIRDNIFTHTVKDYWREHAKGMVFPDDSNCVGCFWKAPQQLARNYAENPEKMNWFVKQEELTQRKFKKGLQYSDIVQQGNDPLFFYGTGSGCQAGFCTD
jgi:hypothetical protein